MRPHVPSLLLLLTLAACAGGDGGGKQVITGGNSSDRVISAAMQASMPDVALRVSMEQVKQDPHNALALARQGDAYRALGRDREAAASYNAALAIIPGETRSGIGLGMIQLRRDPAQAEATFRQVLAAHPSDALALTGLGVACDLQNQHAKAQSAYRAALAVQPGLREASVDLGLSLALGGDASAAVAMLQPLANDGTANRRERDDFALALQLAGRETEARRILGEEMSDADAAATLAAFRLLR